MSKSIRYITVGVILALNLIIVAVSCQAQKEVDDSEAITLTRKATDALKAEDWAAYTDLIDPGELAVFKADIWPLLYQSGGGGQAAVFVSDMGIARDSASGELVEPPDAEFFTGFLKFVVKNVPNMRQSLTAGTYEPIGAVAEGDSLMHVVSRVSIDLGGQTLQQMEVTSLRKYDDEWKLDLRGEFRALGVQMQSALNR